MNDYGSGNPEPDHRNEPDEEKTICELCKRAYHGEACWSDICVACIHNPDPNRYRGSTFMPVPKTMLEERNLTLEDWQRARGIYQDAQKENAR